MEYEKDQVRSAIFTKEQLNLDTRSMVITASSEEPYLRAFGYEVLSHAEGDIDMSFVNSGNAPVLADHDQKKLIGVVDRAFVENGRVKACIRFSKSDEAEEIYQDVLDGIRTNISIGYTITSMVEDGELNGVKQYRCGFKIHEISSVSVPADTTVGTNRAALDTEEQQIINTPNDSMTESKTTQERTINVMDNETIDHNKLQADAVSAETKRSADILDLGVRFDLVQDARAFIESGKTAAEFTQTVLDKVSARNTVIDTATNADVDMSKKEQATYSLARAIYAGASGDWRGAGLEREASEALESKMGRRSAGILIPLSAIGQRAMTAGGAATGAELVGDDYLAGQFVSPLYNSTVVRELGATVLDNLTGNITIPTGGSATVSWIDGETENAGESTPATGSITLSPKTISGFVQYSHKLLLQGSPSVDAMIRNDLASVMRVGIDTAALVGTGAANQPTGILNTSGVNLTSIGTNGGVPTFAILMSLIKELQVNNINGNAFVINPAILAKLRTTAKVSGTDSVMLMEEVDRLLGYNVAITNSMPSNLTKGSGIDLSAMIFGDFSNLILGSWDALEIQSSNSHGNNFQNGMVAVRALQSVDVAVKRPEAFSVIKDMITA